MIKAVVGAGGKTSWIKQQAKQYVSQGYKVFITTSTHMFIEEDTLLTDNADEIIQELENNSYVMAGIKEGEKIKALSKETYEAVCACADVVLIEADGSKHLPLKFPNENEPVIYDNVDEIVVVCGLHALQKKASEVVHRLALAKQQVDITEDTIITPIHIQNLVRKGYLEPLQQKYPQKKITICPNANNSLYQRAIASLLETNMDVSLISEEWFHEQPKLIICGAGHISSDLVKMASCLDFYIKVIDDREEFANKERFPLADEVICDTFDHLERYLEPDAYYIVVTRGHKADFECVETILSHSYEYLGMIGSKKKVKTMLEQLAQKGVSERQLQTIHAPIGLDIKAVTPAEIAVSILAQIILEKNSKYHSFISRELLNTKETGMLCIIIEKSGSSPRDIGSMMLVNDTMVIDTIGGGSIESSVIEEARKQKKSMIKEYYLNNEQSETLGMICGGSNKILFLPIQENYQVEGINTEQKANIYTEQKANIGCIIMASGMAKRFGTNKLLAKFQGKTLIQRILDITGEDVFEKRVVVTRSEEVVTLCKQQNIDVIFHALPNRNDVVRLGIEVMKGMEACIFCPCDQPLLQKESLKNIVRKFRLGNKRMLRLSYVEKKGSPVLFGKEYFEELANLPEKCGGSYLIKKYPENVGFVSATEEIELYDIDTKEDYEWLIENYEK